MIQGQVGVPLLCHGVRIRYVGSMGKDIENFEVSQPQIGGQVQVGGPHRSPSSS